MASYPTPEQCFEAQHVSAPIPHRSFDDAVRRLEDAGHALCLDLAACAREILQTLELDAMPVRAAMNVYELVTEKILAALEAGTVPWHRPWDAAQGSPVSIGSNKAYRGVNVFLLEATAAVEGYRSPYWGTYKAIQEQGGQVRKGEKSTLAVFWTRWTPKDREGTEQHDDNGRPAQVLRYYRVFNAEQADGLPARFVAAPSSPSDFDAIGTCEEIMAGYLAGNNAPSIGYGGSRACYSPSADRVSLPERSSFESAETFYSTAFHELTHSTGHASRLARKDLLEFHRFGDASYSREELVAEMGAAMLSAVAGIHQTTVPQSAAYLASWLKVLRGDSRMTVTAAAQAQKAADMIRCISYASAEHEQAA